MLIDPNTLIPIGTKCIATTPDKKGGVIKTECIILGHDLRADTNMPYYVYAEQQNATQVRPPGWDTFDPNRFHGERVSPYITGDQKEMQARLTLIRNNNIKFVTWLFIPQIEQTSELQLEQILNVLKDECSSK